MLPMYYEYPDEEAAYHCPQQYLFGTELIAAPFVEPADPDTGLSRQVVWLPEGDWYHVFTGEHLEGDRWHAIYGALKDIPLFARAGAILPLGARTVAGAASATLTSCTFMFSPARTTHSRSTRMTATRRHYLGNDCCLTTIEARWADNQLDLAIHAAQGNIRLIPAQRSIHLTFTA